MAALGTMFSWMTGSRVTADLLARHLVPPALASKICSNASQHTFGGSQGSGHAFPQETSIVHDAVAFGMRDVLFGMAAIMAVAFLAGMIGLRRGVHLAEEEPSELSEVTPALTQ